LFRKFGCAALLLAADISLPALASQDIGAAVWIKNDAALESGDHSQPLSKGAAIHKGETIVTGDDSIAEVELLDKTKLAIGSGARATLDQFNYNSATPSGKFEVRLTKGAFRVMTGGAPKIAYEFRTPTATFGVRGAVFDVYVAEGGGAAAVIHEGTINICNLAQSCTAYSQARQVVFVSKDGAFSVHPAWDGAIILAVNAETAFPFLGQRLFIDPVPRWSHAALSVPAPEVSPQAGPARQDVLPAAHLKNVSGEVLVNRGQGYQPVTEGVDVHPGDRVRVVIGSTDVVYWNGTAVHVGNGEIVLVLTEPPGAPPLFADGSDIVVLGGGVAAGGLAAIIIVEAQKSHGASP
jgi:hypothetical protein